MNDDKMKELANYFASKPKAVFEDLVKAGNYDQDTIRIAHMIIHYQRITK